MTHTCHARGCAAKVPPVMLMCRKHWSQVPASIQHGVYRYYRKGQCNLDPLPSKEWHEAAVAAIGYIAELEGHKIRLVEARAIHAYGHANQRIKDGLAAIDARVKEKGG